MSRKGIRRMRRDAARMRMRDMARSQRKGRMDYGRTYDYYGTPEHHNRYDYPTYAYDYTSVDMGSKSGRQYDRNYDIPEQYKSIRSRMYGDYGYDYPDRRRGYYDYASEGGEYLSDDELMEWKEDLMEELDPQYKPQFEMNRVIQRGKEMGVGFKDFTEDEYYVTVLMIATDFGKTIGMNNVDQMFRMALDWLEDDDVELKGSEKLAVYYDEIVCGGEY